MEQGAKDEKMGEGQVRPMKDILAGGEQALPGRSVTYPSYPTRYPLSAHGSSCMMLPCEASAVELAREPGVRSCLGIVIKTPAPFNNIVSI